MEKAKKELEEAYHEYKKRERELFALYLNAVIDSKETVIAMAKRQVAAKQFEDSANWVIGARGRFYNCLNREREGTQPVPES